MGSRPRSPSSANGSSPGVRRCPTSSSSSGSRTSSSGWPGGDLQRRGFDHALLITEFKARAWPESATARAYFGEALLKSGRPGEALDVLLEALELEQGNEKALRYLQATLEDSGLGEDAARRGRDTLARTGRN